MAIAKFLELIQHGSSNKTGLIMVEKACLTKSAFTQLVNVSSIVNGRGFSAALKIYLSLYKDGNISSSFAYTIAKCYLNLFDYSSAEKWIKKLLLWSHWISIIYS